MCCGLPRSIGYFGTMSDQMMINAPEDTLIILLDMKEP